MSTEMKCFTVTEFRGFGASPRLPQSFPSRLFLPVLLLDGSLSHEVDGTWHPHEQLHMPHAMPTMATVHNNYDVTKMLNVISICKNVISYKL